MLQQGTKVFRKKNDQSILETWSPELAKYGISAETHGADKAQWIAEYCHNVAMWENAGMVSESVTPGLFFQQPGSISQMGAPVAPTPSQTPFPGGDKGAYHSDSGSGDKFPSLLPVAIQVAAKTIGFDLVSVIPMDSPVGFIPYLDYVYQGGNLDTDFPPFLIKLVDLDADSQSGSSPGKTFADLSEGDTLNVVTAADAAQATVEFVGYSRVDGAVVLRIKSLDADTVEDAFAATNKIVEASSPAETWTLSADNNTVELVSALENHISGFTSTDADDTDAWSGNYLPDSVDGSISVPESMTRDESERAQFRQMGLKMFTKFVEAKTDQVAISATIEQIQDLNRVWNFDVISMLENVGVNEVAQSINKRIVKRVFELGYKHADSVAKVEGTGITTLSLEAGGGFENTATLQRRLVTKILEMAQLIYHRSRWGAGEFIVTNGRIAAALADVAGYTFQTAPISGTGVGQLYPAGEVYGLKIYVDPNLKFGDNRMLVGRKGKDEEPGLKFLPYIMAESLQTISEGTFSPKLGVKSRYSITEAGWHPETQYVTLEIEGINKILGSAPAVSAS